MTKDGNEAPVIAHVIYRLGVGGLENGLINLINRMPPEKYRHIIVCLKGSTQFRERIKRTDVEIVDLDKKEGQDWQSFLHFYRILKQYKVKLVHTRNLGTIEYQIPAFLAGIKSRVHSEHGWDVFDPDGNNKKYQLLRRLISPLIQTFIPLSLHLQDYLTEKVKIPKSKIHRICNGVDVEKFFPPNNHKPTILDCPFLTNNETLLIGTVGRMHGVKDQITLVTAFIQLMQQHPELKGKAYLLLIGDGPLRQEAIDLLETHQLQASVWLPGERNDIAEMMQILDIFVLPSQAEGISNTILEAMATGLPVIATAVGGNPELVEDGETGFLVPASNPEAMAEAMLTLLTDKQKRQQQAKKAYQTVLDKFSIQIMVKQYTDVYDSVIAKRK